MNSLEYVDFIRNIGYCCVCYHKGFVDPHHLISIGMGGNRKKPNVKHYSCIPLCRHHHTEYHNKGKLAFEKYHNVNLFELAFHFLSNYIFQRYEQPIEENDEN